MAVSAVLLLSACGGKKYESVPGDPLGTKIYTLKNGLKVYMSVNKETPRIQANIAVRSGGKNDPADNTGLAHYLEHIMFKGSSHFGTTDYEAEKVLLDQITDLYDLYRTKTEPEERAAIYHRIDSLSYAASKIGIANEYDKLMSMIGSQGTNAYTSNDVTCYVENIPANQVENWAKVEADRFKNMVVRGFHTELEAVYEEFNMGLTSDDDKVMEAVDSVLFPSHPYGTQTVIGTQKHLQNPSISAILKQKATYYVPNNCAICMAGDLNPDEVIPILEKYFGDWQPNPDIPVLEIKEEAPITSPVEKHVWGNDAEFVYVAWRYPGEKFPESEPAAIVNSILYNGMAGLIDLDVNQLQKTLDCYSQTYGRTDHGELLIQGNPKHGQSLEEVRDLILAEVAKLRDGDFDESLVQAAVANYKLREMRAVENNNSRASKFVNSFIACHDWKDDVTKTDRISALTKEDIVAWANEYLGADSYVVAYKHQGKGPALSKIEAPKITPIETNRDKQSAYLKEFQEAAKAVKPIEPVFVDYDKDMSKFTADNVEVLYKKNEVNGIARLSMIFNRGALDDPALEMALAYVAYLGTAEDTAEDLARQMYNLACNYDIRVTDNKTTVTFTGLDENIGKAVRIVENLFEGAVGNDEILAGLKAEVLKRRVNIKLNMRSCYTALESYINCGPEYVHAKTLTNARLSAITSEELLEKCHSMFSYAHKVSYYGPSSEEGVKAMLEEYHKTSPDLIPLTARHNSKMRYSSPKVYLVNYDSRQFNYLQYSDRGEDYLPEENAKLDLFNEYFGAGMNTIVFQEMRESRALAYSAKAKLTYPTFTGDDYTFYAYIASQSDKLEKAVTAFDEIINDMPVSDKNFEISKAALDSKLRTQRVTGANVINSYLNAQELGSNEPREKAVFEKLGSLTMDDLVATQQKWIKGRSYVYGIVGDVKDLDQNYLKTLGPVQVLSLEEVFGY